MTPLDVLTLTAPAFHDFSNLYKGRSKRDTSVPPRSRRAIHAACISTMKKNHAHFVSQLLRSSATATTSPIRDAECIQSLQFFEALASGHTWEETLREMFQSADNACDILLQRESVSQLCAFQLAAIPPPPCNGSSPRAGMRKGQKPSVRLMECFQEGTELDQVDTIYNLLLECPHAVSMA
eukprot:CAMPEP_0198130230 /NCGR_PEP_ID=MMETSP1442-20131203/53467_1 /TAXON_ID= /ORGANISM="Craspedostauros australis, Strain CCMP3328" /LENGTH=180 /DNA_ID=CAMNT_0043790793 /DNA_START=36 /DNA_END=578 /DNA_ORIENTATION=+